MAARRKTGRSSSRAGTQGAIGDVAMGGDGPMTAAESEAVDVLRGISGSGRITVEEYNANVQKVVAGYEKLFRAHLKPVESMGAGPVPEDRLTAATFALDDYLQAGSAWKTEEQALWDAFPPVSSMEWRKEMISDMHFIIVTSLRAVVAMLSAHRDKLRPDDKVPVLRMLSNQVASYLSTCHRMLSFKSTHVGGPD